MICRSPRDLPSVGALLEGPEFESLSQEYGARLLKFALREVLDEYRRVLLAGQTIDLSGLRSELESLLRPGPQRVLNLTGTVLHTNLGRAPLGEMLGQVAERMDGYCALEYDLSNGKRGKRGESVERLLRWATGAPSALVVNNCSAAMILLLVTLASGREVIVSRGELVEIGGGFRVPDILATSGARLVEVGTTNRTRIADYEKAITDDTALILSTHRSNFEIVGFTESPTAQELQQLGKEHGLAVVYDLGSGMLTSIFSEEPSVAEASGFCLTAFSGDKLLGGPQCGILIGREDLLERCRRHPLFRALRPGKITLALLEEALRRHLDESSQVPALKLLATQGDDLQRRAEVVCERLKAQLGEGLSVSVVESVAPVGGGTLPMLEVPSFALRIEVSEGSLEGLQARLRSAEIPVIGRVERGAVLLDFRSLDPDEDETLCRVLQENLR